jgi:hypothetical protein
VLLSHVGVANVALSCGEVARRVPCRRRDTEDVSSSYPLCSSLNLLVKKLR